MSILTETEIENIALDLLAEVGYSILPKRAIRALQL